MTDIAEPRADHVEVTVRTPAGEGHKFTFKLSELVVNAAATAIDHFVKHQELAPGEYGLAVVRDSESTPMISTNELSAYSIVTGDVLHLINEAPQVDG